MTDKDLVDLPEYEIDSGEILLLVNEDPWVTPLAAGANAADMDQQQREGATAYVVDSRLVLPNTGKFMLLLRNNPNKNGKDENIQDYAGNGFFEDFSTNVSTQFWPRDRVSINPLRAASLLSVTIPSLQPTKLGNANVISRTMDTTKTLGKPSDPKADSATTRTPTSPPLPALPAMRKPLSNLAKTDSSMAKSASVRLCMTGVPTAARHSGLKSTTLR